VTVPSATATFVFRVGLLVLLVVGIVIRPTLALAGELHAIEHAAADGGHGHAHVTGHAHAPAVQDEAYAHDAAAHSHAGAHAHEHADPEGARDLVDVHADSDSMHAADDADPDHARGPHGLLHHHADAGCSAAVPAPVRVPDAFGIAVMLPSSAWASAPPQRASSPFRPPIA